MTPLPRAACAAALLLLSGPTAIGSHSAASTPQDPPPPFVVNDVRLVDETDARRVSLVLRGGRIAAILDEPQARVPGARRIDGQGLLALPAFVDAYSFQGVQTPAPRADRDRSPSTASDVLVEMRLANRKGIQPAFRAIEALDFGEQGLESWRKAGFAVLHLAPRGELLAGQSAVVTARAAPTREVVLQPVAFQSATFQAVGRGYPNTLMGYHAQLRQFLHDARHQASLQERWSAGRPGPRPPYDPDLESALGLLGGTERLVCLAERREDIVRWLRLADEFALRPVLAGGREAYDLVGVLAARKVPVLLTLDWPKEVPDPDSKARRGAKPDAEGAEPREDAAPEAAPGERIPGTDPDFEPAQEDLPAPGRVRRGRAPLAEPQWTYDEPLEVRRERRRLWEETRAGALRLHQGGVQLAFGTGSGKPGELLERVRTLVELGLPREAALDALTRGAAELLGVGDRVGRIAVGFEAHLALWTASPFDKTSRLAWIVIDGVPQRFEVEREAAQGAPDEDVDASGSWTLVFEAERATEPTRLELAMDADGAVKGTIRFFSPFAAEEVRGEVSGQVVGGTLRLDARLDISGFDVDTTLRGELLGDALEGEATWRFSQGEQTARFRATREPRGGDR